MYDEALKMPGMSKYFPSKYAKLAEKFDKGTKDDAQAFFRELDTNGDGCVSRIEFKQMMRRHVEESRTDNRDPPRSCSYPVLRNREIFRACVGYTLHGTEESS